MICRRRPDPAAHRRRAGGRASFDSTLGFDVALMVLVAIVFAWVGAWQFSKAQAA